MSVTLKEKQKSVIKLNKNFEIWSSVKDTLKAFDDLKNKQKSV